MTNLGGLSNSTVQQEALAQAADLLASKRAEAATIPEAQALQQRARKVQTGRWG